MNTQLNVVDFLSTELNQTFLFRLNYGHVNRKPLQVQTIIQQQQQQNKRLHKCLPWINNGTQITDHRHVFFLGRAVVMAKLLNKKKNQQD